MKSNIPFIKPTLPSSAELVHDYETIIASNWFTNFGPFEKKFRQGVESYLDNGTTVTTVANATLGIDLAIRALLGRGAGKKTEVLMPSFTFAAGAEVLISNGFTPVFIDIEESTLQPDCGKAREYIAQNPDTVAGLLLCNIFGVGGAAVHDWEALANEYELPLIIDSAAGFGSEYEPGVRIGARGDCEVFSLHATKPFAVGEGGLVSSRDATLIKKIRELQNFGFTESKDIGAIGTNAKMQEMNCAIGLRQLAGFDERLRKRRATLKDYKRALEPLGCTFQANDHLSTIAFASVLAPSAKEGTELFTRLRKIGVEARRYYTPLHEQEFLREYVRIAPSGMSTTEDVAARILSLPVHDNMADEDLHTVLSAFKG